MRTKSSATTTFVNSGYAAYTSLTLILFFNGCTCDIWKFPGQGSNWSCSCRPAPQPQQHWIRAAYVSYTAACGNSESLTHWVRPGIKPTSSQGQYQVFNLETPLTQFFRYKWEGLTGEPLSALLESTIFNFLERSIDDSIILGSLRLILSYLWTSKFRKGVKVSNTVAQWMAIFPSSLPGELWFNMCQQCVQLKHCIFWCPCWWEMMDVSASCWARLLIKLFQSG